MRTQEKSSGFTIVELLIVIVVIGILAAITIVAYNGIQSRAQDSRRVSDIAQIKKALLAYDVVHGGVVRAPAYTGYAPGADYGGWDVSAESNWLLFLRASHGSMPVDPTNTNPIKTNNIATGNQLYSYYCYPAGGTNAYPDQAAVTLYYVLNSGGYKKEKFPVTSCLASIPAE